jgi:cytochrome c-type biogenesis protein CcmE
VASSAPDQLTPVAPPVLKSRARRRNLIVLLALGLSVVALLSQGLLSSLNYFKTVDEALAQRHNIGTKIIRLEGLVKPHSITRTSTGASFFLTGSNGKVFVVSHGTPPQLFRGNIPVVVVGRFLTSTSASFDGTQIMVKHSSTYIAKHPKRVKAPNGTVR